MRAPNSNVPLTALAMPILDHVPGEAMLSHLVMTVEAAAHTNLYVLTPFNTLPHDRARMCAMTPAMDAKCDFIFWVDDDTMCPPDTFPILLQTMREQKAQVVTGHYYRRGYPFTCVWSKDGKTVDAPDGVHEIDCSGLGCALVDLKWVMENLKPPFFTMTLEDGKSCSNVTDDVSFYEKVRLAGGKVIGNANVRCTHLGERMVINTKTAEFFRKIMLEYQTIPKG